LRHSDGSKNADDRNNDHELDKGKAFLFNHFFLPVEPYQLQDFIYSNPMLSDAPLGTQRQVIDPPVVATGRNWKRFSAIRVFTPFASVSKTTLTRPSFIKAIRAT
jgi:hypothetical protein